MSIPTTRRADWLVPAGLLFLSLVPAIAGASRLAELGRGVEITAANERFFAMPLPVVLHILAVIPYSMIGAFQFSKGFRRGNRAWHRAAGRVLGFCGLVAALTGMWMAHSYAWPASDGFALYVIRLVVGAAMAACIVLGVRAVLGKQRDVAAHGEWMIRAYALGMGAGTQVFTHLPWFILIGGMPPELPRTVFMGGAWALNALVAEAIIRRARAGAPHARRSAPLPRTGLALPGSLLRRV